MELDRRQFVVGSAAVATALTAGAIARADEPAPEGGEPPVEGNKVDDTGGVVTEAVAGGPEIFSTGSWVTPPAPIDDADVVEELVADVVIIGAGHSGTAAARAAAEAGASVIVLEAQAEDMYLTFGNDFGHINSEYLAAQGVPKVDEQEFFLNWMLNAGQRANADLVRKFTKQCGAAFDWWVAPFAPEQVATINVDFWPETPNTLHQLNTGLKYWIGTPQLYGATPDGVPFDMTAAYRVLHETARAEGAQILYGTRAEQLATEDGAVKGVYASTEDGIIKVLANKGVILAAGDFSGNPEMCNDLLKPQLECLEEGEQMQGIGRDGSGIAMGVWAGGRLEPSPLPVLGDFDASVPSRFAALWLDADGKRYMNECAGDYVNTGFANVRHKHGARYVVYDATIVEAVTYNVPAHAAFDPTEEGAIEGLQAQIDAAYAAGAEGFTPERSGTMYAADDLETLADYAGFEGELRENFLASVARYNELCAAGVDEDYGKDPRLLFPVANPPFCLVMADTGRLGFMLVTNGGLITNGDQQVLDARRSPIPGLYATGNCCGQRFGAAYFTPIAGVSLGMAVTLGRDAGSTVAAL